MAVEERSDEYTQICSGQDPQLIDSGIFTTIIPMTRPDGTSTLSADRLAASIGVTERQVRG